MAELQIALPGELRSSYPLKQVLDRRPFINEAFEEHYEADEEVILLQNEHFLRKQDAEENEIITDSCILIRNKKYHIEYQTSDGSMAIRMFEYDTQIALEGSVFHSICLHSRTDLLK